MLKKPFVIAFSLLMSVWLGACSQSEKATSPPSPSSSTPSQAAVSSPEKTPIQEKKNAYQIKKLALPTHPASSFDKAKKLLYTEVYHDAKDRKTFYCGCQYNEKNKVDLNSCGVVPRKNAARAGRVEAEHVFPAHQLGHFRECWRDPEKVCGEKIPGRKCCEQSDTLFTTAHNDLHNLFPAVGEVNGDRSNFNWGMIQNKKHEYGACDMAIDRSIRRAEPPDHVKGDIARVYFYMSATYGFKLSKQDMQLFEAWDKMDPVDDWERERNRRIAKIQGNFNPFVSDDRNELDPINVVEELPAPMPQTKTKK